MAQETIMKPLKHAPALLLFLTALALTACAAGNKQFRQGMMYAEGLGVPQDYAKACEWYKKAAELGNARSMYALGYACQCGQGVEVSMEEALRWYEKAALAGHLSALQYWKAYNK